nr:hypothetical protein CFP56_59924 [Quercus suber]
MLDLCRNLTPRQRELIEEFAKEEQGEYDKHATAGASGVHGEQKKSLQFQNNLQDLRFSYRYMALHG